MQLQKVEKVNFDSRLRWIEYSLMPAYANFLRECNPVLIFISMFITGWLAWLISASEGWTAVVIFLTLLVSFFAEARFFGRKLYLPKNALRFYKANRVEMELLYSRVWEFNELLGTQKMGQRLLPQAKREDDEDLASYWEERRQSLQEDVDNFLVRFEAAVSDDLKNPKLLRRAFKDKVRRLKELETNLANFGDGYEGTKDVSPYVAANKLREQLEEERLELGLPQKALPKPKVKNLLTQ